MNGTTEVPFETLSEDQRFLVAAVWHQEVRVVVIGGYAVRVHGNLRHTEDLDLFVDPTEENLIRLREALASAGPCWRLDRVVGHLASGNKVTWNGVEFFPAMNDVAFDQASAAAVRVPLYGSSLLVLSKAHLIEAKRVAVARQDRGVKAEQDRLDIRFLTGGD